MKTTSKLVFLLFVIGTIYYLIHKAIVSGPYNSPVLGNFPEEYYSLLNKDTESINHLYTYISNGTFPVSAIEVDSLLIYIFKFSNKHFILKKMEIEDNHISSSRFIFNYVGIGSPNLDNIYRNNLTKKLDTIYIRSTKFIDTLVFDKKLIILKGVLGNLEVKVDKSKKNADEYFENKYFIVNGPIKYYLVWIKKNEYIYELFIEAKKFDDKRILELFQH